MIRENLRPGPRPSSNSLHDVSAIVLSNGEAHTERALESLERQTLRPAEIIPVGPEVSPFYRAFDAGAAQVKTRFFVQVDSDMVLDGTCLQSLRDCMTGRVGMVSGLLRDPILTRIMGVQLFRSEAVRAITHTDSIVTESNFSTSLQQAGWVRICALNPEKPGAERNTLGLHDPGYTPESTFSKFLVTGTQIRCRGVGKRGRSFLQQLLASQHRYSIIACIAAARGFTLALRDDILRPFPAHSESVFLETFLNQPDPSPPRRVPPIDLSLTDWRRLFEEFASIGQELCRRCDPEAFVHTMRNLVQTPNLASFVALTGLCNGLFRDFDEEDLRYDYDHLANLLN